MMYEFVMYDENGCLWNWEDDEENDVVIEAENEKEAFEKFIDNISSEYEEEAKQYYARRIDDFESYREIHHYVEWD